MVELDPELEAEFDQLVARTDKANVRAVLIANKEKLVSNFVSNKEALEAISKSGLMGYQINEGHADILKGAFASPGTSSHAVASSALASIQQQLAASAVGGASTSRAGPSSVPHRSADTPASPGTSAGIEELADVLVQRLRTLLLEQPRASRSVSPAQTNTGAATPNVLQGTGGSSQQTTGLNTPASPPMQVSSAHAIDSGANTAPAGGGVNTPDPELLLDNKCGSV